MRIIIALDLIKNIKTPSSKWLKTKGLKDFEWQVGYGAFSVSESKVDVVKKYIQNQTAVLEVSRT